MTSIVLPHHPAADVSVDLAWLRRLSRRFAALNRRRRYPSARRAARRAAERWASAYMRHSV